MSLSRSLRSLATTLAALALAALGLAAAPAPAAALGAGDGFVVTLWGDPTEADLAESVRLAAGMGARHVSYLVFLHQDSPTASEVRFQSAPAVDTPFDQMPAHGKLTRSIADAHARGMSTGLIPFPFETGLSKRHFWNPANRAQWFRTYGDRLADLARFAEQTGCDEVIAGSELSLLFQYSSGWRQVIARIRGEFTGHVTVCSTFPDYPLIRFWDACDSVGISGYFPLAARESTASATSFEWAWRAHRAHLLAFCALWRRPLTFVEVGYPAMSIAAARPWDYDWSRAADPRKQMLCFEAFRRVWSRETKLRRFQIWGLSDYATDLRDTGGKGFSPIGKQAEPVVRRLFPERAR